MRGSFARLARLPWFLATLFLLVLSLPPLLHVGYIFLKRASFPFELEWIEGLSITGGMRVLEGKPLYAPPDVEFVGPIYTPFYFYVLAPFLALFGKGFLAGRILSILSFVLALLLSGFCLRLMGAPFYAAIVLSGIIGAGFEFTGGMYDLARVDSFSLFLFSLTILLALKQRPVLSGISFLMLVMTKQTFTITLPAFALLSCRGRLRPSLLWFFSVTFAMAFLALALDMATGHWFLTYTVLNPSYHPVNKSRSIPYFTKEIIGKFIPLWMVTGAFLLAIVKGKKEAWKGHSRGQLL